MVEAAAAFEEHDEPLSFESGLDSLLLGAHRESRQSLGFHAKSAHRTETRAALYDGDAHLCTVAPTRSGKGIGVIAPNLMTYRGPVVVFDPKGENYEITARRRREMGHQVVRLDPFEVCGEGGDAFNPLDLFGLKGIDVECDSQSVASLLARGITGSKEPFWDINGSGLSAGLIACALTQGDQAKKNLNYVVDALTRDDVVYNLAVVLDTVGKEISKYAHREIASMLQMPDITRGGVLATAQTYFKPFMSDLIGKTLDKSSFSLQDFADGKPISIYLVLPPSRLHSHRGLLKLWMGTLLAAILTRKRIPRLKTLFLIDEAAQLESFPLLEPMITLAAGYGVWVHTFWQDLSQLKTCYPESWKTILNNCGVIQTFGIYNRDMAVQWGEYFDAGPAELRSLSPEEQIIAIHGRGELRCRRLNYLTDRRFAGMFDKNSFYANRPLQTPPQPKGK